MCSLLFAIEFLTILPVRRLPLLRGWMARAAGFRMARTLPWFPVVGASLGATVAGLDGLVASWLARGVRDALVLVMLALLTGMLHLDGFVDCCDGLLGSRAVERRLEILRDSRVGAYGAIGAVLLLLTQFAALEAIPTSMRAAALIAAPTLGRWCMVIAVVRYPYARVAGAGTGFQGTGWHIALATLAMLALLALTLLLGRGSLLARAIPLGLSALGALAFTLWYTWWASRRLGGGLTGDTYGALNELVTTFAWIIFTTIA